MKKIYISPENRPGPHGPYAGYPGVFEHDICQEIGSYLKEELERCGFEAVLAAPGTSMASRTSWANANGVDLYMTVHTNAGGGTGAEVLAYDHPESRRACQLCYDELTKLYPSRRGVKNGNAYFEINQTRMVSVYPELAFHDNPADAKFLVEHKRELAAALCRGVCGYFGVQYREQAAKPEEDYRALYEAMRDRHEALVAGLENLILRCCQESQFPINVSFHNPFSNPLDTAKYGVLCNV